MSEVDFFNLTAIRVHGKPQGWRWYTLDSHEMPEDFIKIEGGSSPCDLETIWIRERELDETRELWERESGKCSECLGSGKTLASWSKRNGETFRQCKRCEGTGNRDYDTMIQELRGGDSWDDVKDVEGELQ